MSTQDQISQLTISTQNLSLNNEQNNACYQEVSFTIPMEIIMHEPELSLPKQ